MDDLKKMGAWFPTAAQAVSWFRKRRSAVIRNVAREGDMMRTNVRVDEKDNDLPGLKLRVHRPAPAGKGGCENDFVETTINHSGNLEIAV